MQLIVVKKNIEGKKIYMIQNKLKFATKKKSRKYVQGKMLVHIVDKI